MGAQRGARWPAGAVLWKARRWTQYHISYVVSLTERKRRPYVRTLVTNGVVVTAADTFAADILIEDGKIAALGHNLGSAADTIDAHGMYV